MAWNFRRRVKIIPGVHLNFSKNGISTSIGVKGASMTFGPSGTYLNAGIPALGIYNRQKLTGEHAALPPSPQHTSPILDARGNIFSADIHEITSQDMQGVKEAILLARQQHMSLTKDLSKIQRTQRIAKLKKTMSYLLLYGLIKKSIPENLMHDILAQNEAIKQTKEHINESYVRLEIDFDPEIQTEIQIRYETLMRTFVDLTRCHRIWDVTSAHYEDRAITRSSAGTVVTRKNVGFSFKSIPEFKSAIQALYFQNANGADLYIYPSFIVMMHAGLSDFGIIGLDEIDLQQSSVRFTETEPVPTDSKIIDQTWAKVNKNGTPDRRFKGNYQIPVVRYGEIRLKTHTGVHEEYEFSNYEASEAFAKAFQEYQAFLRQLMV